MVEELKQQMKEVSDTLRDLATNVNNLTTKFDEMTVKVDRLAPLAPVATQLAVLPEKVVALQASSFEHAQEVRALNLVLIRVEKQRDGKAPATDGDDPLLQSVNGPPHPVPKPPPRQEFLAEPSPPFPERPFFRSTSQPYSQDPREQWRERKTTSRTPASTRASALSSRPTTAKKIPCPGSTGAKHSFAARAHQSAVASGTRRCTSLAPHNYGITGWNSPRARHLGNALHNSCSSASDRP
jgi:hypothetical protein